MRAHAMALRFLVAATSGRAGGAGARVAVSVRAGGETLRGWAYAPARPGRDTPTVLALHGLSPLGADDPRMDAVARALAAAGCRVIAPELPDTARLRLGTPDLARVRALLAPADGPPPAGVFAASFSATLALRSAADIGSTAAICAVGPSGDVPATVSHLLHAPDADPYGRVVLFRNFGGPALGASPAVEAALDAWLAEDRLGAHRPAWLAARAALSPADRALADDVVSGGPRARAAIPATLAAAAPVLDALDVRPVAARVRGHVTLLHGAGDIVVPARESVALAAALPRAALCVTPLLSHGDTRLGLSAAPALPPIVRALASWFERLPG
jgi:pimeloyl-ACP methyl ester carboxylesterase